MTMYVILGYSHVVQASYNQFYFAEMNVRSKRHPYFNKKGVMEALAGLNHSRVRTKQVKLMGETARQSPSMHHTLLMRSHFTCVCLLLGFACARSSATSCTRASTAWCRSTIRS